MDGRELICSHMEKQAMTGTARWRRESQQDRNSGHRKGSKLEAAPFIHIYRRCLAQPGHARTLLMSRAVFRHWSLQWSGKGPILGREQGRRGNTAGGPWLTGFLIPFYCLFCFLSTVRKYTLANDIQ